MADEQHDERNRPPAAGIMIFQGRITPVEVRVERLDGGLVDEDDLAQNEALADGLRALARLTPEQIVAATGDRTIGDPDDLADLQYPELDRRRDELSADIEEVLLAGGIFDPRLPPLNAALDRVLDAARRKREGSKGRGYPHRKKGQEDDTATGS